jgi:chromosome segregation ATPase
VSTASSSSSSSSSSPAAAAAAAAAEALAAQRADAEEWRSAFLRLQDEARRAELARDDQERHRTALARAGVERELALARQKSITLAEQVKALELSAEELLQVSRERDTLAARLVAAGQAAAALEATAADLRNANARLSEGLDAAMLTTRQTRDRLVGQEDANRDLLLQADQRAGKAENALGAAEERIRDLQERLDAALRDKADAASRNTTLEEQLTMERTVASEKVQEFAGKLQSALTSRDESTHTYQLALAERAKRQETLEAEVRLLQGNPSEARKLRKKLRRAQKRLKAFERAVGSNTEELQRHATWLQEQVVTSSGVPLVGGVPSAKAGSVGRVTADAQGRSLGILLPAPTRLNNNRMEELNLQSNAGQSLLFRHALSVI